MIDQDAILYPPLSAGEWQTLDSLRPSSAPALYVPTPLDDAQVSDLVDAYLADACVYGSDLKVGLVTPSLLARLVEVGEPLLKRHADMPTIRPYGQPVAIWVGRLGIDLPLFERERLFEAERPLIEKERQRMPYPVNQPATVPLLKVLDATWEVDPLLQLWRRNR